LFRQAHEFDLSVTPVRNLRNAFEQKTEGEANPAECRAQAWDAVATASGFAQGGGPFQDIGTVPTPVSSPAGGGAGVLPAQGRPVTMAIGGTLTGFALIRATWTPAAGGAGTAGSNQRDPRTGRGPFVHSVRLEPGQTVWIDQAARGSATSPAASPPPTDPFEPGPTAGTVSVSVTFTCECGPALEGLR